MGEEFFGLFIYCIPAVVTAAIAFFFFREYSKHESRRTNSFANQAIQKEVLVAKLQAYERLTLFLERSSAQQLLTRVAPIAPLAAAYKDLLIATIKQEYEHNLAQQIYVSEPCWHLLFAAKDNSLQIISSFKAEKDANAETLRPLLLAALSQSELSPKKALKFLKEEVSILLN